MGKISRVELLLYVRTQLTLVLGSILDFAITIFFVQYLGIHYLWANLSGNVAGSATQFFLGRSWAFRAARHNLTTQAIRFIAKWIGNWMLSAAGLYVLTHFASLPYLLSKLSVSVILGLTYQYWMQKHFVFSSL